VTFSLFWVSHVDIIRTSYPAALASVAGRILLLYFYTFARMAMADILMDLVFPAIVYFFPLLPQLGSYVGTFPAYLLSTQDTPNQTSPAT